MLNADLLHRTDATCVDFENICAAFVEHGLAVVLEVDLAGGPCFAKQSQEHVGVGACSRQVSCDCHNLVLCTQGSSL